MAAPTLSALVAFCDRASGAPGFPDFDGAYNGLQCENDGRVTKIGAAVDANLPTFELAAAAGVDFLISHHGMMWGLPRRWTGVTHRKLALLLRANLAVYGCHLPLDAHPRIGNNALLARELGLRITGRCLAYEGRDIAVLCAGVPRATLEERLMAAFPAGFRAIRGGPERPRVIAVCAGGAGDQLGAAQRAGADTYLTGEGKQHHFGEAMERGMNLYFCGHYATETHGVKALAAAAAKRFRLPWQFLDTGCPL